MNLIAQLESKLDYYDVIVQQVNYYATKTSFLRGEADRKIDRKIFFEKTKTKTIFTHFYEQWFYF